MDNNFVADIAAVQRISAVPSILDVVCRTTGMGFAAVARVTEDRWIACQVLDNIHFGLAAGGELKVETTLCHEVRQRQEVVVFDHAANDPNFATHHTPQIYGLQSYISVPIVLHDGQFFGTLCAIDPNPHKVNTPEIVGSLKLFAELIAYHLDADDKLRQADIDLKDAVAEFENAQFDLSLSRAGLELREQFIAVLGHDLRNPLAAIEGGRRILSREHEDAKSVRVLRLMGESVTRMSGLIDNLMDFARGRLGGGIGIERQAGLRIEPTLANVINEIKVAHPDRTIESRFDLSEPVAVDHARIAQMFSNLLGNAINHGAADTPVVVEAYIDAGQFALSVANGGAQIAPDAMDRLFQPFSRSEVQKTAQGLGLGLYIAAEIAKAHGGRLEAKSDPTETRFTFHMPVTAG